MEKFWAEIVEKGVFLQRQRKSKGLRTFAQSFLTAGLGIIFLGTNGKGCRRFDARGNNSGTQCDKCYEERGRDVGVKNDFIFAEIRAEDW